ncbi:hypothetical protein CWR48_13490 [Oceanobacillus arenosus]|uniref:Uncharacterized protein n=1 Tax=Oceanobacillus arenosus TaxID=1229153 RepID=A0A3D8PN54_9BACI|nr:nuclease domain-containing protein [Oceanobacillus arenosus]RDW17533.1 hypothetical protein CWR48_13490 [Oceanobacillus arenosus]
MYNHKHEGIGLSYPIPLKDTFQLYEIWCYMMVVKVLRELGYVKKTNGIFKMQRNSILLDLAENKESSIYLKNKSTLYFQRIYQKNTNKYYTYTQRMIPDIVIEGEEGIIIFDPKYL